MLSGREQSQQQLGLGMVGGTDRRGVDPIEIKIFNRTKVRVRCHRINRHGEVSAGDPCALASLHAHPEDRQTKRCAHPTKHRSLIWAHLARSWSRETGMLPSSSHSTAAAKLPRMPAITQLSVARSARAE